MTRAMCIVTAAAALFAVAARANAAGPNATLLVSRPSGLGALPATTANSSFVAGAHHTHIATLVERQSRFTILVKVQSKDTRTVVKALGTQVRRLPAALRKSLTWDRGLEMAAHKEFSIATYVRVYFCDPKSPWQLGTNENTNRLLRQYFPKGTDLSACSQADLNRTALQLNRRPRKTLAFRSPAEVFHESALIG